MCTHHVEQMFVFTNAFRQDYCTIPFPFVTPYYSDRDRDQCFNCFLISPDGKIVPADYADRMMFWTRRCMQIDRDFRRRQQPPIVGAAITSRSTLTCCLLSNSRVSKMWPADFRHGDDVSEVKKRSFCFLMGALQVR